MITSGLLLDTRAKSLAYMLNWSPSTSVASTEACSSVSSSRSGRRRTSGDPTDLYNCRSNSSTPPGRVESKSLSFWRERSSPKSSMTAASVAARCASSTTITTFPGGISFALSGCHRGASLRKTTLQPLRPALQSWSSLDLPRPPLPFRIAIDWPSDSKKDSSVRS